ncbi:hypothetical protein N9933_03425 [bacterium]|nr:hypothetical protein [bacterium]
MKIIILDTGGRLPEGHIALGRLLSLRADGKSAEVEIDGVSGPFIAKRNHYMEIVTTIYKNNITVSGGLTQEQADKHCYYLFRLGMQFAINLDMEEISNEDYEIAVFFEMVKKIIS